MATYCFWQLFLIKLNNKKMSFYGFLLLAIVFFRSINGMIIGECQQPNQWKSWLNAHRPTLFGWFVRNRISILLDGFFLIDRWIWISSTLPKDLCWPIVCLFKADSIRSSNCRQSRTIGNGRYISFYIQRRISLFESTSRPKKETMYRL